MKSSFRKTAAIIMALIIVLASVAFAFAESGAATGSDGAQSGAGSEAPGSAASSDGAQSGTAAPAENSAGNEAAGANEEQMKQKTDLYTVMALIALGAIVVGIRDKRRGR